MDSPGSLLICTNGNLYWQLPGQATCQGSAEQAAHDLAGHRCLVFVPGSDVLLTGVKLPTRNRQRLLQAIPFALEEQLSEDPDVLHYALGGREPGGDRLAVAVVARSTLDRWLVLLQEIGVQTQAMVPDVLALPDDDNTWQVAIEDGLARVRTGAARGFAVERENLPELLGMVLNEAGQEHTPERILITDFHPAAADSKTTIQLPEGTRVEWVTGDATLLDLLSKNYLAESAIDLLQGDYSRREQLSKRLRPWLGVAAMALLWIMLLTLGEIIDYHRLNQQRVANQTRIDALYQQVFPKGRKQTDYTIYQSQMRRELAKLRSQGEGTGGLLGLLYRAGQALKDSRVELQGGQYRGKVLDLDLRAGNLAELDRLKQTLDSDPHLQVELQNAASRNGRIEGHLRIRSRS